MHILYTYFNIQKWWWWKNIEIDIRFDSLFDLSLSEKRQQPAVASSGSSSICNSSLNRRLGTPRSCRSSKFPRGAQHPDSTPQGARPLSPHNFEAGTSGPSSCCRFRAKDSRVPGPSARLDTAEEEAPRLKKVLTLYNILYCYIIWWDMIYHNSTLHSILFDSIN